MKKISVNKIKGTLPYKEQQSITTIVTVQWYELRLFPI